jgi:hypothetical protein
MTTHSDARSPSLAFDGESFLALPDTDGKPWRDDGGVNGLSTAAVVNPRRVCHLMAP